jgi:P-type Ca2+ transporter type 2C
MTGDGVNDGLALKAAHIGIAMGKKGTAIAKDAASLVLVEDDLSKMVEAVAMGRRIYSNLRKAIQYIISIHIPIILIIFIPLLLGWVYPAIFSPVHVILLELIMGPTCSIAFESDPMETNAMLKKPRVLTASLFNKRELGIAILQGIAVTLGLVAVYQYAVRKGYSEELTRTMVFTTLVMANIVLTEVSRSREYSVFTVARYKNALIGYILAATAALLALTLTVPALRNLLAFSQLTWNQLLLCMGVAAVSVLWYEGFKYYKRRHQSSMEVPIKGTAASKP